MKLTVLGLVVIGMSLVASTFFLTPVYAQTKPTEQKDSTTGIFKQQDNAFKIPITLPQLATGLGDGTDLVTRIFNFVVELLQLIAGIAAFAYFLYGGFTYMTAGGDPGKVDKARKIMIGSIIGLLIVIVSYVIVAYVRDQLTTAAGG